MSILMRPRVSPLRSADAFPQRMGRRLILIASFAVLLVVALPILAQNDDAVHIMPRMTARNSKTAEMTISDASLNTYTKPLRHEVELVLVPVTVTDPIGRPILGLEKECFEVYEGKQKQAVRHFSLEDAPVSVGIIFDMSRSMKNKFDKAKQAVMQFMQTANLDDEFFLIGFSDRVTLLSDFTSSSDDIQRKLVLTAPQGVTALLDAIGMGMSKMKNAKYQRKALLIISDGGDNHSRYTESEIKSVVEEGDVQLFAIGIFDGAPLAAEERYGPTLLGALTSATGGTTFFLNSPNELPDVAGRISSELRHQYVLAFTPLGRRDDGKWHAIRVKLAPPDGLPRLTVHAKSGYYAHE